MKTEDDEKVSVSASWKFELVAASSIKGRLARLLRVFADRLDKATSITIRATSNPQITHREFTECVNLGLQEAGRVYGVAVKHKARDMAATKAMRKWNPELMDKE